MSLASSVHQQVPCWTRYRSIIVLVLALVSFTSSLPFGWSDDVPLTWDQAGHFHDAMRLAEGLRHWNLPDVQTSVFGPDLYPPGHSLLMGVGMALLGSSLSAWMSLNLLLHLGTVLLLLRLHWFAAVVYLSSPMLSTLAVTFMVEPVASLLLAAALVSWTADGPHARWSVALLFGVLVAGVVLTKYNVGLPLLPAIMPVALLAAITSRDKRPLFRALGAIVLAASISAIYVTLQEEGWHNFLRFAENRANAQDQGVGYRLAWYWTVFSQHVAPGWLAAAVLLALPSLGLWRLISESVRGGGG
jgi:4-amino-4-deoxy-L-arabinose transferase-like glycosyltransferase